MYRWLWINIILKSFTSKRSNFANLKYIFDSEKILGDLDFWIKNRGKSTRYRS